MRETKTKTITYKRVQFSDGTYNLKVELGNALQSLGTVGMRREQLGTDPNHDQIWRLIGTYKVETDFFFGVLMKYKPGHNPPFLVDDENATTITIEQFSAPTTTTGQRRELVDGMLFFGVIDNHMAIIQSLSLRSVHLEEHLVWLFRESLVFEGNTVLTLVDQAPTTTIQSLENSPVKSIEINSINLISHQNNPQIDEQISHIKNIAINPSSLTNLGMKNKLNEVIKYLIGRDGAAAIDECDVDNTNLKYTLKIQYPYKTDENGHRIMEMIGSSLRNAEDITSTVTLKNGTQLRGDDFKLTGKADVITIDGVPSAAEVFEEMKRWLLEKITEEGTLQ